MYCKTRSVVAIILLFAAPNTWSSDLPPPLDRAEIVELFDAGDFASLEQIAQDARTSKAINTGGLWQLSEFYTALAAHSDQLATESESNYRIRMRKWADAYPDSVTWRVVLAAQLIELGWDARGTKYAHEVSASNWKIFEMKLTEAWKLLQEAKSTSAEDPAIFAALMTIGMGIGDAAGEPSQPQKFSILQEAIRVFIGSDAAKSTNTRVCDRIFNEAVQHEDLFPELYTRYVITKLPRWGGAPGAADEFAAQAAERTSSRVGDSYYARIAISLVDYEWEDDYQQAHSLDWSRIKSGLDWLLTEYPEADWFANNACRLAFAHADREAAAEYRSKMKRPMIKRVWKSNARLTTFNNWVDGTGPYPHGGPLGVAVTRGENETARRLLEGGADPDALYFTGATPLLLAAVFDNVEGTEMLLMAGANPNVLSTGGNSPLAEACRHDDPVIVDMLLQNRADPDFPDAAGWLPLAQCVKWDKPEFARLLIKAGADVNGVMPEGWTALHVAAEVNNIEMAKLLLEHGADIHAKMDDGRTPKAIADQHSFTEIAGLLDQAGQ